MESHWESLLTGDGFDARVPKSGVGKSEAGTHHRQPLSSSPPDPYKFPDDDDGDDGFGPEESTPPPPPPTVTGSSPAPPSAGPQKNGTDEASPEKDGAGKDGVISHTRGGAAQYKNETQLKPTIEGTVDGSLAGVAFTVLYGCVKIRGNKALSNSCSILKQSFLPLYRHFLFLPLPISFSTPSSLADRLGQYLRYGFRDGR